MYRNPQYPADYNEKAAMAAEIPEVPLLFKNRPVSLEKTLHQMKLFRFGDPFQNVMRFEKAVPKTVILL